MSKSAKMNGNPKIETLKKADGTMPGTHITRTPYQYKESKLNKEVPHRELFRLSQNGHPQQ